MANFLRKCIKEICRYGHLVDLKEASLVLVMYKRVVFCLFCIFPLQGCLHACLHVSVFDINILIKYIFMRDSTYVAKFYFPLKIGKTSNTVRNRTIHGFLTFDVG